MGKFGKVLLTFALGISLIAGIPAAKIQAQPISAIHYEEIVEGGEINLEPPTEEGTPVIEEKPCKVTVSDCEYGDLIVDVMEGEVGDLVTIYAKPYMLCALKSMEINGSVVEADEDGYFRFTLVDGENTITPTFAIDTEQLKTVAQYMADIKDGKWKSVFTIDNLFSLISWIFSSGVILFILKLIKMKQKEKTDLSEQAIVIAQMIKDSNTDKINSTLQNVIGPGYDKIAKQLTQTENIAKVLARCMLLSQENTPEARLSIAKELTDLTSSQSNLSEEVKALIASEIAKNEAEKAAKQAAIAEIEAANEAIQVVETEPDVEGRV